jgi:hypothetical protein
VNEEPRTLPPVAEVAVASLALIIVGGIYMASYVPRRPLLVIFTVDVPLIIAFTVARYHRPPVRQLTDVPSRV